ncbi:MAG TPA: hypothetical protein VGI77_03035 [Gaiellaceae bacterium]|jgi:hypothetical protein
MSTTATVVFNVLLGLGLIGTLLFLLGIPGVHADRHHRRRLREWHSRRKRPPRHVADQSNR